MDELGDRALVVATNPETTYSHDVENRFRPHSDFWYLTGFNEPGAALVLAGGKSTLFLRARDPQAEVWNGRRLGLERAQEFAIDQAFDTRELTERLPKMIGKDDLADVDHAPDVAALVEGRESGAPMIAEMRLRKDAEEIAMLQKACDVGVSAMQEALPLARPGSHEYQVEAALVAHYRAQGSTGPGYPPIVGAGANAAILHYIENRAQIKAGDMVLVDAGCEWGYYNSDITRTVPADDGFTETQADLYALVEAAQQAAMAKIRPGNSLQDVHQAAALELAEGFLERGWMQGELDALMESNEHRRFYMHGTSHYLGLDVHDVGRYKDGEDSRVLEEGMVITVEPGLYLNPDYTKLPPGIDPLGIRIENDVVVTADGMHDLTRGLPTDLDGVLSLHNP